MEILLFLFFVVYILHYATLLLSSVWWEMSSVLNLASFLLLLSLTLVHCLPIFPLLQVSLGERSQEEDSLTSKIQELEAQLSREKEECKR